MSKRLLRITTYVTLKFFTNFIMNSFYVVIQHICSDFLGTICHQQNIYVQYTFPLSWHFSKFGIRESGYSHRKFLSPVLKYLYDSIRKFLGGPLHTESFDWFLSSFERILNLQFCLLKLLKFCQKLLWSIRSRLNSSTFWVCI